MKQKKHTLIHLSLYFFLLLLSGFFTSLEVSCKAPSQSDAFLPPEKPSKPDQTDLGKEAKNPPEKHTDTKALDNKQADEVSHEQQIKPDKQEQPENSREQRVGSEQAEALREQAETPREQDPIETATVEQTQEVSDNTTQSKCPKNNIALERKDGTGACECYSRPAGQCYQSSCWTQCTDGQCEKAKSGQACEKAQDCMSGNCVKGGPYSWSGRTCSCKSDQDCAKSTNFCIQGKCATLKECKQKLIALCTKDPKRKNLPACDCNQWACLSSGKVAPKTTVSCDLLIKCTF